MTHRKTRILLADDHEMMRAGLCGILQRTPDNEVIAEAANGRQAVELAARLSPDVVILDVAMPMLNGIEALRQILRQSPDIKAIMLSIGYDSAIVSEALAAGACAYVLKSGATVELELALRAARDGSVYLSPRAAQVVVTTHLADRGSGIGLRHAIGARELGAGAVPACEGAFQSLTAKQREVLQLLAEGMTNKEVAASLSISTKTAEAHRAQLMDKLQIHTVAGLTKYAIREGLTSVDA